MARTGPTTLALPPFEGATRRIVLLCLGVFFAAAILGWVLTPVQFQAIFQHLFLTPRDVVRGDIWELVTYIFMPFDPIGELFTLIFLWFVGAMLEEERGSRWLYEMFFTAAIGGAVIASALSFTHILDLSDTNTGFGLFAGLYGLLIAVLVWMGDREFILFFVIRLKAKYFVIIYLLFDTARLLLHDRPFDTLLNLSGAFCGFLFIKHVPRRGLTYLLSERYFSLRNDYYRSKRRRAARKFEVYMRSRNREVHFDRNGKYVEPDDKDPTDRRWMN
jgi:membrane associated rhomboid family serine protease